MAQKETVQQGKQRETELPDLFFNELKLQKKKTRTMGRFMTSWCKSGKILNFGLN
jgi:hypothetical protein